MYRSFYILILVVFSFISCDFFQLKDTANDEEIVASVGSVNLYRTDLNNLYEPDINERDSLLITNNFIENWARKQIILQKASLNIPADKKAVLMQMIDEYREDLYINSYKDALVSQNIDTIIHEETIKDFYIANQNIFRLKEEILKFKYLNFNSQSADRKKIKELFQLSSSMELDSILYKDIRFSINQLNDSTWYTYKDFLKTNPILEVIDKKSVLRKNHFIEETDSVNTHFIKIKDVRKRNEIAPLEHVEEVIKTMIIHKKKLKYINELDSKLIEDAIKNNTFKKY